MRRIIDFTNRRTGHIHFGLRHIYWHGGGWDWLHVIEEIDYEILPKHKIKKTNTRKTTAADAKTIMQTFAAA